MSSYTIGLLLVFVWAALRFKNSPPPPTDSDADEGALGRLVSVLKTTTFHQTEPLFGMPPRSNTTVFKFVLYQLAYATFAVFVYVAVIRVPELAGQVEEMMKLVGSSLSVSLDGLLSDAGPVLIAFVLVAVLPNLPPFAGADLAIRRELYERASIPAQQLCERNRLKAATFVPAQAALDCVVEQLVHEGFDARDLVFEERPTTRSIWMKACLLMYHIEDWETRNRYKTAFCVVRERDGKTRTVDYVRAAHDVLKGDAITCFSELRDSPDAPETKQREAAFRGKCLLLLTAIYDLLSRISLHAHFSERERLASMAEIGFRLVPSRSGPVPDLNDMCVLGLLIAAALVVPLASQLGIWAALVIGLITIITVVTPVLIASHHPWFVVERLGATPAVAFPLMSGAVAALLCAVLAVALLGRGDLLAGWERFTTRGYPWSAMQALIAALIAWRIRSGDYPDPNVLAGWRRYRLWGSLRDAGIFATAAIALMIVFVLPALERLGVTDEPHFDYRRLAIASTLAALLGFIVPTWHRASTRRTREDPTASPAGHVDISRQEGALG